MKIECRMTHALLLAAALAGCSSSQTRTDGPEHGGPVIEDITPEQAFILIQDNRDNADFVILDVRTPEEFAAGHLQNAVQINFYDETFSDDIDRLDKARTYLVYCRSGGRSSSSLRIMAELGFTRAHSMLGGIVRWQTEGLPVLE